MLKPSLLALSILALSSGAIASGSPKALFADAKQKRADAEKLRTEAGVIAEKFAVSETQARTLEAGANLDDARALFALKADAKVIKAFELRAEALALHTDAGNAYTSAKAHEGAAANNREIAAKAVKVQGEFKSNAALAWAVANYAKARLDAAKAEDGLAKADHERGAAKDKLAASKMAEAGKLFPDLKVSLAHVGVTKPKGY